MSKLSRFNYFTLFAIFLLFPFLLTGTNIRVLPLKTHLKISNTIKRKIDQLIVFRMQLALEKNISIKIGKHSKNRAENFTIKTTLTTDNNGLIVTTGLFNNSNKQLLKIKTPIKDISFIYGAVDQATRAISEKQFPLLLRSKKIDLKILVDASANMNLIFGDTKRSLLRLFKHAKILNKKDKIKIELLFFRNNQLVSKNSDDQTVLQNIKAIGFQSTDINNIIYQLSQLSWQKNSSRFLIIYTNSPLSEINSFILKSLTIMGIKIIAIPADKPTMTTIQTLNRAAFITKGFIRPPIYAVNYATGKDTIGSFILNENGELSNLERPFYSKNFFYYPNYVKNPKRVFIAQDILDGLEIVKRSHESKDLNINNIQSNLAELIFQIIENKIGYKLIDRITPNGKIVVKAGKEYLTFIINDSQKYELLRQRKGKKIYLGIFLNPSSRGNLILKNEPLVKLNPPKITRTTFQRILKNPKFYRSRGLLTPNCWFIPVTIISFKD